MIPSPSPHPQSPRDAPRAPAADHPSARSPSHSPERRRSGIGSALLLAAALGATALWVRHSAHRAEARHPARGRFVEIDGVRLHYLESGSGPPVVLLHGNGAMASDFEGCGLIQALEPHHRVIAFDRPGFGFSTRPRPGLWPADRQAALLVRACRALGAAEPVVVGHSWGALVAIAMAVQAEATLRGLVLVSGYFYPTARIDVLQGVPRLPLVGDVLRYTVSPLLSRLVLPAQMRLLFSPRPVSPAFLGAVPRSLLLRPWQLRAAAEESGLTPTAAARLTPGYSGLRLPVEIFAGADDRFVWQDDQSVRLHRELAHSTLHLLDGKGHMLHYDVGGAIAEAVERLSAETPVAATTEASTAQRR